ELAFKQLNSRQQGANEPVTQYVNQVIHLCTQVNPNMDDSTKIDYLKSGLKNSLKMFVALKEPSDPTTFLQAARIAELYQGNSANDQSTVSTLQPPSTPLSNKSPYRFDHRELGKKYSRYGRGRPAGHNYSPFNESRPTNNNNQYSTTSSYQPPPNRATNSGISQASVPDS
ncbi:unnamed protein product, partial [Didymodactylos carnosus]